MEDEACPVPPLGGEATGDRTNAWWRDGGNGRLQWVRSQWQDRTATWKRVTKSEGLTPRPGSPLLGCAPKRTENTGPH